MLHVIFALIIIFVIGYFVITSVKEKFVTWHNPFQRNSSAEFKGAKCAHCGQLVMWAEGNPCPMIVVQIGEERLRLCTNCAIKYRNTLYNTHSTTSHNV